MTDHDLFAPEATTTPREKSSHAFKTISEVAEALAVPAHVLRFWESKFSTLQPTKLKGGRRYYRPTDIELLRQIKHLLYDRGYTIKGAQAALEHGEHHKSEVAKSPIEINAASLQPHLTLVERVIDDIATTRKAQLHQVLDDLYTLREMLRACA